MKRIYGAKVSTRRANRTTQRGGTPLKTILLATSVSLFMGMQVQGSDKREYKESLTEYISPKRLKTTDLDQEKIFLIDAVHKSGEDGTKEVELLLAGKTLEEKFDLVSTARDSEERTLLHIAVRNEDYEVAQILTQDFSGEQLCTLLSHQDDNRNVVLLHTLIKNSRNHNTYSRRLLTELLARLNAAQKKELAYIANGNGKTALFYAETPEVTEIVLDMVSEDKRDDYITLEDNLGFTALTVYGRGNLSETQALLDSAKNKEFILTKPNKDGKTPLQVVVLENLHMIHEAHTSIWNLFRTRPCYGTLLKAKMIEEKAFGGMRRLTKISVLSYSIN